MKKEIMNLINIKSDEATYFRLNNISYLRRWTMDGLGNEVDRLTIEFDTINEVRFSLCDREIRSRDYAGIISECQEKTEAFLQEVSRSLGNDLKAGYRNASRTGENQEEHNEMAVNNRRAGKHR